MVLHVEIADALADDGFAGDEDAAVIEDAAVALDVDLARFAEDVAGPFERGAVADDGDDIAEREARFGGGERGLVGGIRAGLNAGDDEAEIFVETQYVGEILSGDAGVLNDEVADFDGLAGFGTGGFDAEGAAVELEAEHDAEDAEGVSDTEGDDRSVGELLEGDGGERAVIVADDFLGGGERGSVGEGAGEEAGEGGSAERLPVGDADGDGCSGQQHGDAEEIVAQAFAAEGVGEGGSELNADAVDEENEADGGDDGGQGDIGAECAGGESGEEDSGDAEAETEDAELAEKVADADDGEKGDDRELRQKSGKSFSHGESKSSWYQTQFISRHVFEAMMFDSVKRFPFLDWMRGLAILVMIECHTFNSFTRVDLRDGGPYILSQFIGGMAAPLFLFMAGMTMGFQMESLERREARRWGRWRESLKRAGFVLFIAFTFRFTNWLFSVPHANLQELTKVDILNCMGVGMAALAALAAVRTKERARAAVAAGVLIAAISPLMTTLPWGGSPALLQEYLVPGQARGHFPFFPWVAYIAFGLAVGTIVKRAPADRFDRLMQWSVLIGGIMITSGQYFSNLPFSFYPHANFWTDSPALISIRVGICLLIMAGSYLWTEYCAGARWSWMQALGKNSLMVYWIHVMIVYGAMVRPVKRSMDIPQATVATAIVAGMMVLMSALWLRWKGRKAPKAKIAAA